MTTAEGSAFFQLLVEIKLKTLRCSNNCWCLLHMTTVFGTLYARVCTYVLAFQLCLTAIVWNAKKHSSECTIPNWSEMKLKS